MTKTRKRKEPMTLPVTRCGEQNQGLPGYPRLSWRMNELNLTNDALARQVGVTGSLISHIRLGHRPVTAGLRRDIPIVIARALGIDADELRRELFPDEPQPPQRVSVFQNAEYIEQEEIRG